MEKGPTLIKMTNQQRRVVVTGVGLVSPVGVGTEVTWRALLQGESGIGHITLFDASGFSCRIAGEVKDFIPEDFIERKEIKKMGRFIQFALAASEFAMQQARLDMTVEDAEKVGVYVGSGIGAFEVIEREHSKLLASGPNRVSPFFITATIANLAAGQISIRYGATGPNLTCATACTTGAHAIGRVFPRDPTRRRGRHDRRWKRSCGNTTFRCGLRRDARSVHAER